MFRFRHDLLRSNDTVSCPSSQASSTSLDRFFFVLEEGTPPQTLGEIFTQLVSNKWYPDWSCSIPQIICTVGD